MATIKDVAELAGVSQATVSRVVNGNSEVKAGTRSRVLKAIEDLGYQPNRAAQQLAKSRELSLGLVVATFSEPFFLSLTASVGDVCQQVGINFVTSIGGQVGESEERAMRTLWDNGCRAVIFHSKYLSDERLTELCAEFSNLVLINRFLPEFEERCVWLDNKYGGEKMVKRLSREGHAAFASINSEFANDDPHARAEGWESALSTEGGDTRLVAEAYGEPTLEGGYSAMSDLLARNTRFSALLVYDDTMAVGAIRALADHGIRVPQDVSVVGFNDSYMARFCIPKLTTLHYPVVQMALEAANVALALMKGGEVTGTAVLRHLPVIIDRQSISSAIGFATGGAR